MTQTDWPHDVAFYARQGFEAAMSKFHAAQRDVDAATAEEDVDRASLALATALTDWVVTARASTLDELDAKLAALSQLFGAGELTEPEHMAGVRADIAHMRAIEAAA